MVKAIESKSEFDALVKSGEPVVVDFHAAWCGPCKLIGPHFAKAESKYPDVKFVKVDVDDQPEIAEELQIKSMPTFISFKNGEKLGQIVGAAPAKLATFLEQAAA